MVANSAKSALPIAIWVQNHWSYASRKNEPVVEFAPLSTCYNSGTVVDEMGHSNTIEDTSMQLQLSMTQIIRSGIIAGILASSFVVSSSSFAQMQFRDGMVGVHELPAAVISKKVVFLDVPHKSQDRDLCVPTSSAMILAYFGEEHSPELLKTYAENHKPPSKRNTTFTYWADMRVALRKIGHNWRVENYRKNTSGFNAGFRDIKRSLRRGRPVMVDVHLGEGHTFVVAGYNDNEKIVYIRDPLLGHFQARKISYSDFKKNWHNHKFSNSRSAFFSRPN